MVLYKIVKAIMDLFREAKKINININIGGVTKTLRLNKIRWVQFIFGAVITWIVLMIGLAMMKSVFNATSQTNNSTQVATKTITFSESFPIIVIIFIIGTPLIVILSNFFKKTM